MLLALRVQSFILIDSLELRLEPGFNVLTGETGAGKSIVIGALELVLGGRARADMIRPGAKEACVEALFDVREAPLLKARLEAMGVSADEELVVRRIVQRASDGCRTRAYLNGRLCSLGELSALAAELADVTSQHASVALTDPSCHLALLDRYARSSEALAALGACVDELVEVTRALGALRSAARERAEREDFLRYQLEGIEALDPQPGELEALGQERSRLRHAERLGTTTLAVAQQLEGDDGGLLDALGKLVADLEGVAALDETLAPMAAELDGCWSRLREVARELARYGEGIEADPQQLAQVQDRIFRLEELLRRHGPSIDELIEARARMQRELADLAGAEERAPELEARRARLLETASAQARELSKHRRRAARRLGKAITAELSALGMGAARVLVDVLPASPGRDDGLVVDGARLGREGIDRAQFLIAPNKGVDPQPLHRIASGGELSRALLALKRALGAHASSDRVGVQVLDEVDSGVGGATADCIGRAIADIARHRQVLCITHLAAIAAHADAHYVVSKDHRGDTTTTSIERVEGDRRVSEMARMLTGAKVSGPSKRAAKELLAAAS